MINEASRIPKDEYICALQKSRHSPRGKGLPKRMTISQTISGDLPSFMLEQQQRLDPKVIREVSDAEKTWHNGGGGGIRSIFKLITGKCQIRLSAQICQIFSVNKVSVSVQMISGIFLKKNGRGIMVGKLV